MNCLMLDFPNPMDSNKKRQDIRNWSFVISKEIYSLDISFGRLVKTNYLCWLLWTFLIFINIWLSSCVFGVMENAMVSWRVLIRSFLEDLIRNIDTKKRDLCKYIGGNFSGLVLLLLTYGVFTLCFLTPIFGV